MSGARTIRVLLADVDGTLLTQDKVLTGAAKERPGSCATPALCSPSPAACAGERRYRLQRERGFRQSGAAVHSAAGRRMTPARAAKRGCARVRRGAGSAEG
jgi:hypothetical protein